MQRSILLLVPLGSALTAALAACAPLPGLGPMFGPDSGASLLIFAVIGLCVYGVQRLRQQKHDWWPRAAGGRGVNREPAIQILRERYAKGEISRNDYLQSLDDLVRPAPSEKST